MARGPFGSSSRTATATSCSRSQTTATARTAPPPVPASRSCGRSSATSFRAASTCAARTARAPRWCSQRELPVVPAAAAGDRGPLMVAAPPYAGEGPRALWHVSEDPTIERFEPRGDHDPRVWAIDTRHLPLYWFPRDCPRATFWAGGDTNDEDVERFLSGDRERRVHAIESAWLERMRNGHVFAYRMREETFQPFDRFWVSRDAVEPLDVIELGDLLALHADAGIELRLVPDLLALWDKVVNSSLDFSGIRLRNVTLSS